MSPPALAPIAAVRPSVGLRELLAPVIPPPGSATREIAPQAGPLVAIVPDLPDQPESARQGFTPEVEVVNGALGFESRVLPIPPAFAAKASANARHPGQGGHVCAPHSITRGSAPGIGTGNGTNARSQNRQRPRSASSVGPRGRSVALAHLCGKCAGHGAYAENAIIAAPTVPAGVRDAVPRSPGGNC